MKRIACLLLLSLFLFNIVGYYALYFTRTSNNKAEIRKLLSEEKHLEVVRVHKSDVKNILFKDEGKELLYQGEMYDIKSISRDGNYIVFHCINDRTEKRLLADLSMHVKNNTDTGSSPDKKQNDSSKKPIKDLFLHKSIIADLASISVLFPEITCDFTSVISPPLPLPPPELLVFVS